MTTCVLALKQECLPNRELGNAHAAMQALSSVKHIKERTAEEFNPNFMRPSDA
jgi:hypothetical protein